MRVTIDKTLFNKDTDSSFLLNGTMVTYGENTNISTSDYALIKDDPNFNIDIKMFNENEFFESPQEAAGYTDPMPTEELPKLIVEELELFDAVYTELANRYDYADNTILSAAETIYKNINRRLYDSARKTSS